ncbi:MAG TPA: hypothetical protein VGA73_09490, partial [Candidatus Binatia bacterium]
MKLTIYRKMVLGFAVIIGIMIAAQGYMLFELHTLSKEAQETLTLDVQAVDLAKRLRSLLDEEDSHARKYSITRDRVYYELFQETSREFQKVLAALVRTEAERGNLLHQVAERHHTLLRSLPEPGKAGRALAPAGDVGRSSHIEFIDRSLKGLIKLSQLAIDGSTSAFVAATDRTTWIAAALALLTILAASAAAGMIAHTITRPIARL